MEIIHQEPQTETLRLMLQAVCMPDYGGGSVLLTVGRSFSMAGNLSLGSSIGGDMVVKNHWTKTGGTFTPNNRAVFFNNASGAQTIELRNNL